MRAGVGRPGHRRQPRRVGQQWGEQLREAAGRGLGVRQQQAGARVGQHPGVVGLVVARGVRVGDQHRGDAGRRELRHRRRARPAHHQVGGRVDQVHPVQVGHGACDPMPARGGQPGHGVRERRRPRLDQQLHVLPVLPGGRQPGRRRGQAHGAQAAAVEHHQAPRVRHPELPPGPGAQHRPLGAGQPGEVRQLGGDGHSGGQGPGPARQVLPAAVEGHRHVRGEAGRELVGPARYRVGLVDDRRQPGQPGPEHGGRARIAAHADGHLRSLGPDHGPCLPGRAHQRCREEEALGAQRRVEGDHVHGVQPVAGGRDQLGLQAAFGADERDHGVRDGGAQRLGQGEAGIDVAAGATRADHDGQRPVRGPGRGGT